MQRGRTWNNLGCPSYPFSLCITFGVNCASVFSSRIAASLIFCSLRIFHVKPSGRWIFAISILWAFSVVSLKINRIEEKEKKSDVFVFTHSLLWRPTTTVRRLGFFAAFPRLLNSKQWAAVNTWRLCSVHVNGFFCSSENTWISGFPRSGGPRFVSPRTPVTKRTQVGEIQGVFQLALPTKKFQKVNLQLGWWHQDDLVSPRLSLDEFFGFGHFWGGLHNSRNRTQIQDQNITLPATDVCPERFLFRQQSLWLGQHSAHPLSHKDIPGT